MREIFIYEHALIFESAETELCASERKVRLTGTE